MATYDLFWQSYIMIEKEVLDISNIILFDDNNLNVYSLKIADLIMRVNVEIEALAKELHVANSGPAPANPPHLMYDTDCLKYLDSIWTLSKKEVDIVYNMAFFTKPENKSFHPLREAHKMGDDGPKWKQAYQALKHDRSNSMGKATLKNLLRSMAALFLLNIYHSNYKEEIGTLIQKRNIDLTLGSKLFAVKAYEEKQFDLENLKAKNQNVKESTVIVYPDPVDVKKLRDAESQYNSERMKRIVEVELKDDQEFQTLLLEAIQNKENPETNSKIQSFINKKLSENIIFDIQKYGREVVRATTAIHYMAELNKNQF